MKNLLQRSGYLGITLTLSVVAVMQATLVSAAPLSTIRISADSSGGQSDGRSDRPSISADGRFVAFQSRAANLVANDTNSERDIFVRDTTTSAITRISVSSTGGQSNDRSDRPSISADGRFVAFESEATNLASDGTNDSSDIFVRDIQAGTTTRVSVNSAGNRSNDSSYTPSISSDGRFVAFESYATDLVPNDTNDKSDIFVRDIQAGTTTRVSVNSAGDQSDEYSDNPSISSDGRFVAFSSEASNLVPNDTNDKSDIFVRDIQAGTTTRVSVNSAGDQLDEYSDNPSISSDGRFVAFESYATNPVSNDTNSRSDIFVRDIQAGTTTRVSVNSAGDQSDDHSYAPSISSDGHHIAFSSEASNLVSNDTNNIADIFVHDIQTSTTTRVSVGSAGDQADEYSDNSSISGDGRHIAYESDASNLVSNDTNFSSDIFLTQLFNNDIAEDETDSTSDGVIDTAPNTDSPGVSAPNTGLGYQGVAPHITAIFAGIVMIGAVAISPLRRKIYEFIRSR